MPNERIEYTEGDSAFEAYVAWPDDAGHALPGVLVSHAWAGRGEQEQRWADELAQLGYVGVAIDVYGKGRRGTTKEENQELMKPLLEDRDLLLRRLSAAVHAAGRHAAVDRTRLAAIGFCFGGLCVLDMARGGLPLKGVVSFHGLLRPRPTPPRDVKAKVLVCHGWDDPMVPPDQVVAFAGEMTDAGVDWQLHAYGHTVHAFTNPQANDPGFGTVYQPDAARRSRRAMEGFFEEIFS